MKFIPVFIFILSVLTNTKQRTQNVTLNVHDRVALLKLQIAKEINQKKLNAEKIPPINNHDIIGSYEYVEVGSIITPIMDDDERKNKHRFKLKQLKTTEDPDLTTRNAPKVHKNHKRTKAKDLESPEDMRILELEQKKNKNMPIADDSSQEEKDTQKEIEKALGIINEGQGNKRSKKRSKVEKFNANPILLTKKRKRNKSRDRDVLFYRRYSGNYDNMNKKFVHCQDLITPYLTGHRTNMTEIKKKMTVKDRGVLRLIQLIGEDTTGFTTEEIYSVLYQISNLQIRLFQWDIPALKLLFNVITKENLKKHTFRTLKDGLKRTLESWHIDIKNTTSLLLQARLFRPPCIRGVGEDGSTKSSKTIRYTTPDKPRCSDESDSDSDCV